MQTFDTAMLLLLNGFARQSWTFDKTIFLVADQPLLKGGVLVALLWWSWSRPSPTQSPMPVLRALAGALVAVAAARALQRLLPLRQRPLYDPDVIAAGFKVPFGVPIDWLHDWSSFPSDHAVLMFNVSTALFLAHRGVGTFAYAWSLVIVCLPRVYLGLHYPSDIAAGAALGVAIMLVAARMPVPARAERAATRMIESHPGLASAALFLATYQVATLFQDARSLATSVVGLVSGTSNPLMTLAQ